MITEKKKATGVYQLKNGNWAYRFIIKINGQNIIQRRSKDENGKPFKTQNQASKAREIAIAIEHAKTNNFPVKKESIQVTVEEIFNEYCKVGRNGKAYSTIRKQDSLWENHLKKKFGKLYINEIRLADIQDYLTQLYYDENRAYSYVNSFLKMFYLIYGQAYSRNYIDIDTYNKMCKNKDTKIHMPKMKIDEDTDIVTFSDEEISVLSEYFKGTNAETAYMLGKYCGLRINECYGLKWCNVDFKKGIIKIDRQMQYQNGIIKLVSLKTRNARREIIMAAPLKKYLLQIKKHRDNIAVQLAEKREQNQTYLMDMGKSKISSLELVNSLDDGKIQTVNSMKYHTQKIKKLYGIAFKYHYLRHTYATNLATLNTPEHLLCNQLGHSNVNVTHKYYIALSEKGIATLKKNLELI